MKKKYGFRFFGTRSTTCADDGKIAGKLVVFDTDEERQNWISREKLSSAIGLGGGERISVTRQQAIKLVGRRSFEREVESHEMEKFQGIKIK